MQARIAIGCTAVLSLILVVGFALLRWPILSLYVPISDVANVLAPLILAAAFIERAVEVIISPFRDPEAAQLRHELAVLQATKPINSQAVAAAEARLNFYTGETQKYAFCALFLLGLCAAFVGVRAFGLFLIQPHPVANTPQLPLIEAPYYGQNGAFRTFDVIISALLLAGGANGLHAPINALTSFFNNNANKSLTANATPPVGPAHPPDGSPAAPAAQLPQQVPQVQVNVAPDAAAIVAGV